MTTKGLKIQDVGESGCKILSALNKWMMVSEIASETGLSNTTIRRVIQRLETFGLVCEELQYSESNSTVQSKHFNLTKEGRAFLKRVKKSEQQKTIIDAPVMLIGLPSAVDEAMSFVENQRIELSKPIDIIIWLRQKAQEFNAMADDLSVYEE